MTKFTIYDPATNKVIGGGTVANDGDVDLQPKPDGAVTVLGVMGIPGVHNYVGGQLVNIPPPVLSLAELKAVAKQSVADRRWEIETGGVTVSGTVIATDDRSKLLLSSAAEKARADSTFTAKWKTADGSWAQLDAVTILAIYAAVFGWVDQCFAREAVLDDLIDAAADEAALDALSSTIEAFWP